MENERNFERHLLCISKKIQDKSTESSSSGANKEKSKREEFPVFNVPELKESSLAAIKFICTHQKKVPFQSETIVLPVGKS